MCVAMIGSRDHFSSSFRESAAHAGFELWFIDGPDLDLASKIEHLDALVIMDGDVSRQVKESALELANSKCIPAFCATCEAAMLCGALRPLTAEAAPPRHPAVT